MMCEHFDQEFFDGAPASEGHLALAGWIALHPAMGRLGPERMFRADRALKGCGRLAPGWSRLPEAEAA